MRSIEEDICCNRTRIFIGRNAINVLRNYVDGKVLVVRQRVIDPRRIASILGDRIVDEVVFEGGERDKDINNVMNIIRILHDRELQRKDYIVAVGGGTLTDIAGFVASVYLRGIRLVNVPTTLLGMVDAAIGGKNGVNFGNIKNVIGTFYQPFIVVSDLEFLDTLPIEEMINGMAEVIKYSVIMDRNLYEFLERSADGFFNMDDNVLEDIIYRSTLDKISIVKQDPYELTGIRAVLNFGHTVGHAIEAGARFSISHGKAVAVGMVYEAMLAVELSIASKDILDSIINILKLYRLPTSARELGVAIDRDVAAYAVTRDKKVRDSYILMPLPTELGKWSLHRIDMELVRSVLLKCLG